jgi:hypothetical protein
MYVLRGLGKNIDKTISDLKNDPEYMSAYNIFVQNEGKALQQLILYGGGKEMAEFMKHLRRTILTGVER